MSEPSDNVDTPLHHALGDGPITVVHVVVLGDIARSPRMQYHALKLVEEGWCVQLSGYCREANKEDVLLPPLKRLPETLLSRISILPIREPPQRITNLRPRLFSYLFKLIFLAITLFFHLLSKSHSRTCWYLLQCPPAVPTFLVTWLVCSVRNHSIRRRKYFSYCFGSPSAAVTELESRIAIDWHNYGFTLIEAASANSLNSEEAKNTAPRLSLLGRIYRFFEVGFARLVLSDPQADWSAFTRDHNATPDERRKMTPIHFAVTRALQMDLHSRGIGPVSVLYDRPTDLELFHHITNAKEIHRIFTQSSLSPYMDKNDFDEVISPLTEVITNSDNVRQIQFRADRPFLLVSSCSWSIDDDFGPLLKALDHYVDTRRGIVPEEMTPVETISHFRQSSLKRAQSKDPVQLPKLLCIITGKGEMKEAYLEQINERQSLWKGHVKIVTPWLDAADYPAILNIADLGVCLHRSTSGLDLPMKVVDMFASELPVLSLRYSCIKELVLDSWNGHLFSNSEELFELLFSLLSQHQELCFSQDDGENACCRCVLSEYRTNLMAWRKDNNWHNAWKSAVSPRLTFN